MTDRQRVAILLAALGKIRATGYASTPETAADTLMDCVQIAELAFSDVEGNPTRKGKKVRKGKTYGRIGL